jgi:hypothetical protein
MIDQTLENDGFWDAPRRFWAWLSAIEHYDRAGKQPYRHNGPIGYIGINIAETVARECGANSDVASIGDLPRRVSAARSAVTRAVQRLVAEGFLEYTPGARGRAGAYRPKLPTIEDRPKPA